MWANLHLLFWLSLIPVLTEWIGEHYTKRAPPRLTAVCLGAAVAFTSCPGDHPGRRQRLAVATPSVGHQGPCLAADVRRRTGLAFLTPWISYALLVGGGGDVVRARPPPQQAIGLFAVRVGRV